ncbi:hypothetical protein [Bacteroides acidifaciens]|uniref:hypothetical protein n=1 Tax=Bacteroides acidifaciens TaxID=85831 RepID=UPI0025581E99|nr:hypothetical protein [Bacteroides acidifaciens]
MQETQYLVYWLLPESVQTVWLGTLTLPTNRKEFTNEKYRIFGSNDNCVLVLRWSAEMNKETG